MTRTADIEEFGRLSDGTKVHRVTIASAQLQASIITYGATVQDLRLTGHAAPLVLGATQLEPYLNEMKYVGAIVGRFANRIAHAHFACNGTSHHLSQNFNGAHCLHGGAQGTSHLVWTIANLTETKVTLSLQLPDGHMGFPGDMSINLGITVNQDACLQFDMRATTTKPTPCSLAHHGYFILDDNTDISGHLLQIGADTYLPVDADQIPIGAPAPVAQTPLDFRVTKPLGAVPLDHAFCLNQTRRADQSIATMYSPRSGVSMQVWTNQPSLHAYTGSHFPKGLSGGLDGRTYGPSAGLALEAQQWPDAPNRPDFPSAMLHPDQEYRHLCQYQFEQHRPI